MVRTVKTTDDIEFTLGAEIGRGSNGVVSLASRVKDGQPAAIKEFRGEDQDRFQEEIRTLRATAVSDHPFVIEFHGNGTTDGRSWYAMEYCDGESLRELVTSFNSAGLPENVDGLLKLLIAITEGLRHLHENGVIHRDVKPSNILLTADQEPRWVDFGTVKWAAAKTVTVAGHFVGSRAYASPEVLAHGGHCATYESDVFSLGVVLYEIFTGKRPFEAAEAMEPKNTLQHLRRHRPASPHTVSDQVPQQLSDVCMMCLRFDPCRRYASAEELLRDLQRIARGLRPRGPEKCWRRTVSRFVNNHRRLTTGLTVGLTMIVVASCSASYLWHVRERDRVEQLKQNVVGDVERATALAGQGDFIKAILEVTKAETKLTETAGLPDLRAEVVRVKRDIERRHNVGSALEQLRLAELKLRNQRFPDSQATAMEELIEIEAATVAFPQWTENLSPTSQRPENESTVVAFPLWTKDPSPTYRGLDSDSQHAAKAYCESLRKRYLLICKRFRLRPLGEMQTWGFITDGMGEEKRGLRVDAVTPGSIAAQTGVLVGDRILTINGEPVYKIVQRKEPQQWIAGAPRETFIATLLSERGEVRTVTMQRPESGLLGLTVDAYFQAWVAGFLPRIPQAPRGVQIGDVIVTVDDRFPVRLGADGREYTMDPLLQAVAEGGDNEVALLVQREDGSTESVNLAHRTRNAAKQFEMYYLSRDIGQLLSDLFRVATVNGMEVVTSSGVDLSLLEAGAMHTSGDNWPRPYVRSALASLAADDRQGFVLASAHAAKEDFVMALKTLDGYLRPGLRDEDAAILALFCHLKRDNYAAVIQVCSELLRDDPLQAVAYKSRAEAHVALGNPAMAIADLKRARDLRIEDEEMRDELARLEQESNP